MATTSADPHRYASVAFTGMLQAQEIAIGIDGGGAWRATLSVERLWRSVPCEEVHLRADASLSGARASLGQERDVGNGRRRHSRPGGDDAGAA